MPKRAKGTREIRDIRFPTSHVPQKPAAGEIPVRKLRPVPAPPRPVLPRRRFPFNPLLTFLVLILAAGIVGGFVWYEDKMDQARRLGQALGPASSGLAQRVETRPPGSPLPSSIGGWLELFRGIFSNYGGLQKLSIQAFGALNKTSSLIEGLPLKFLAKDGPGVIADLTALRDSLKSLKEALQQAGGKGSGAAPLPGISEYAAYAPDVERAQVVVERLLALLQSPGEHHVLILFGNSAELRPGGGFLGSFADLTLGDSRIGDLVVRDVNEVDRGLTANIVPPKPLQGLVGRWRAADANWFFDYPSSARKTLEIMSQSSLYASSTLEGAVLISPKVIQDILAATGPVTLSDGGTVVTAETVIALIQREVQAGQANDAENPKEILSKLLPLLEEKLRNLPPAGLKGLTATAQGWFERRDMAIFMSDPDIAKALAAYHVDAASYPVPQEFYGDYLAAVNANVGGGKSDAFIADTIDFQSDLRADGLIENRVAVVRESSATASEEWWYRVTNQDYLQVFTPVGAELTALVGGHASTIVPRSSFSQGFETDPDLAAMESTLKTVPGVPAASQFREVDKNVFATWLTTPAGGSGTARFEYRRALKSPFRDGDRYVFVFERQSGARQSLRAVLNAPPGFVWQEGGESKYEYFSESVPGRTVIDLTLKAI